MVAQKMETQTKKMNGYPEVAVVILNWNGQAYLEKFLPALLKSTYPNIHYYVGDNGSTDGSVDFLKTHYPDITCIQNPENYGFTGGYNKVLDQIHADYYVLLNSDVEVTPGWIEPVISYLEEDLFRVAAQPKILSYHQKTKFEHAGAAGGFLDKYGFPFCRGRIMSAIEADEGQYDDNKEVFWASGAALFIKSAAWKEMEGFDDDFFAHMEEIDLCWRLKSKGYKISAVGRSRVYHVGGGTLSAQNPQKTYLNFRNSLIMMQKNLPFFVAVRRIFLRFWMDFLALLVFLLQGKPKDAWAISRAHQSFFRQFRQNAKKRKRIRQKSTLKGVYKGWIVWVFWVNKIRKFNNLNPKNFV